MKSLSNGLLCFVAFVAPGFSQITLGTAAPFAVIAVKGIISSGSSLITGNMGTTGQSITGFPPGLIAGTSVIGSGVTTPSTDAVSARTSANALTATTTLPADLPTTLLVPGTYKFSRTAVLEAGTITLNGTGQYVFQVASTLTTNVGSEVVLAGGAEASDVFWAVGSSVNLGAGTTLVGSVLSQGAVVVGSGAVVNGSVFSGSSVTLTAAEIGVVA